MFFDSRLLQPRKAREVGTAVATELETLRAIAGASRQVHRSWRERIAAPTFDMRSRERELVWVPNATTATVMRETARKQSVTRGL